MMHESLLCSPYVVHERTWLWEHGLTLSSAPKTSLVVEAHCFQLTSVGLAPSAF